MIQSLREMIGKISFVPENQNTFTAPTTQTNSSYWDMSKDVIKQLFTVHYHSTPVSPIKNSNQGRQLQQYLLLKTSELEWALLNNDYAFYQNNLKIIQQQLHSVVMNQHQQEAINRQIQSLQAITFGFPRAKIISQIEKNDYQQYWPFDVIIFPSENALINVSGRLREVGKTNVGRKMREAIQVAKHSGMSCEQPNSYIRLCLMKE